MMLEAATGYATAGELVGGEGAVVFVGEEDDHEAGRRLDRANPLIFAVC